MASFDALLVVFYAI